MPIYQFSKFRFDNSRGSLTTYNDETNNKPEVDVLDIQLRRKVANLLSYLIANRTRIISKEELLSELWLHGDYRENSLTQSIRELRSCLGDNAKSPSFIKTYPQRGYQWIQTPTNMIADDAKANEFTNDEVIATPADTLENVDAESLTTEIMTDKTLTLNEVGANRIVNKTDKKRWRYFVLACVFVVLACFLFFFNTSKQDDNLKSESTITSVVVLPFINATKNPSMGWLELGLADMLAIDLQRHNSMAKNRLHVTPPAIANALLLNAQLPWPTLPVHIRSLLKEHNINAAIFASVRLYKEQQVLDFQIIYAHDEIQQGSISYPSLPAALQSISQQILHLLNPSQKRQIKNEIDNPITSQALVQGMQSLQKEGPARAKKYFQAVLLLEEKNNWAKAYSARSAFALGQWDEAKVTLNSIESLALDDDPSLDAFVHYWLAKMAFRQGNVHAIEHVDVALKKAEAASDAKQMARSYRLKAQIAWQKKDWLAHNQWLKKAQRLFAVNNELNTEADRLFYLGSPSNSGLDKAPDNDLKANQPRLLKALNFYQQLGNQPMVAASQFAIAQNYTFDMTTRDLALQTTINLYKQLQQPYELAQALNYAGFYSMQLHDGTTASRYFSQARDIAQMLGAKPLLELSDFYLAFAMLDQGLDQRSLGRHGTNVEKLRHAISLLEKFMVSNPNQELLSNALVFLGWANTELGHFDLALTQLKAAKKLNAQLNMFTTLGYSNYSIMRIYIEQDDFEAVIAMANEKITTRLQATYLARAYYETSKPQLAINVLNALKVHHPKWWQPEDEVRLGLYQSSLSGVTFNLGDEPKAHLVYCESDWTS